jgi:hypothetical protein
MKISMNKESKEETYVTQLKKKKYTNLSITVVSFFFNVQS